MASAPTLQALPLAGNSVLAELRRGPKTAVQRHTGQQGGSGHPDVGAGRVGHRLGGKNVRTLANERGRQTDRQVAGQSEISQAHIGSLPLCRHMAGERREQMSALRGFLLELRNRRFVGCQLAAQTQNGRVGHGTRLGLYFREMNLLRLQFDQPLGGVDFGAIGGPRNDRVGDVGCQREIRRPFVGVRHIDFGVQPLDQTPLTAEYIQGVADRGRQCEQIEDAAGQIFPDIGGRVSLAGRSGVRIDRRIKIP